MPTAIPRIRPSNIKQREQIDHSTCWQQWMVYPLKACLEWVRLVAKAVVRCFKTIFCIPLRATLSETNNSLTEPKKVPSFTPLHQQNLTLHSSPALRQSLYTVGGGVSPVHSRRTSGNHTERYATRVLSDHEYMRNRRHTRTRSATEVPVLFAQGKALNGIQLSTGHRQWLDSKFESLPSTIKTVLASFQEGNLEAAITKKYLRIIFLTYLLKQPRNSEEAASSIPSDLERCFFYLKRNKQLCQTQVIPRLDKLAEELVTEAEISLRSPPKIASSCWKKYVIATLDACWGWVKRVAQAIQKCFKVIFCFARGPILHKRPLSLEDVTLNPTLLSTSSLHKDSYKTRILSPSDIMLQNKLTPRLAAQDIPSYIAHMKAVELIQVSPNHRCWFDKKFAQISLPIKQILEHYQEGTPPCTIAKQYLLIIYLINLLDRPLASEDTLLSIPIDLERCLFHLQLDEDLCQKRLVPIFDALAEDLLEEAKGATEKC